MPGRATARRARTAARSDPWWELADDALLDLPIRSLGLAIEGSKLERRLDRLDAEFERRGLRFRPYAWLSTDWFVPDGVTGFAIPFALAHPRLERLERKMMLEVEGASRDDCLRLMRHEAAHAIDNAYGLRRRRDFRGVFGRPSAPYRSSYTPDPTSRNYVVNLDYWYAQSHPLEDFAETFAVWLRPKGDWRKRYANWPAVEKLHYVDGLMREIADERPHTTTRRREEPVKGLRRTLRSHYAQKQAAYTDDATPAFDGQLTRVYPSGVDAPGRPRATPFLRKRRPELVRRVADATGQHRYLLDHVVREMIRRAKARDLRLPGTEAEALVDGAVVLTSLTSQFLMGAHPRYHR